MNRLRGFMALTSVLVLSAFFLLVCIGTASRAISKSQMTTARIERDTGEVRADACVEHALIELSRTLGYQGDDTIAVGDGSCTIMSIDGEGNGERTIRAYAQNGAHTYRAEVVVSQLSPQVRIQSYTRVVDF